MALFGDIVGGLFGSGGGNTAQAYQAAQESVKPWSQAGEQSLGQQQQYLESMGQNLQQYGNPADWMWSQINQSPEQFYQTLMGGYEQSPQYQQQMSDMEKAMVNAAAASGRMGGGSFYDQWQRNAQDIAAQDQDRWLSNLLNVGKTQQGYLQDYRGTEENYLNNLSGLSQMGLNAAAAGANYGVGAGQAMDANNPWSTIGNIGSAMYLGGIPKYGGSNVWGQ